MQATSKGSDQTARMRRLNWCFAGRTYHIVGNITPRLNYDKRMLVIEIQIAFSDLSMKLHEKKESMLGLTRENLTWLHVNNKGADQTAHPRSLVNTFVVRSIESTKANLATCKISLF